MRSDRWHCKAPPRGKSRRCAPRSTSPCRSRTLARHTLSDTPCLATRSGRDRCSSIPRAGTCRTNRPLRLVRILVHRSCALRRGCMSRPCRRRPRRTRGHTRRSARDPSRCSRRARRTRPAPSGTPQSHRSSMHRRAGSTRRLLRLHQGTPPGRPRSEQEPTASWIPLHAPNAHRGGGADANTTSTHVFLRSDTPLRPSYDCARGPPEETAEDDAVLGGGAHRDEHTQASRRPRLDAGASRRTLRDRDAVPPTHRARGRQPHRRHARAPRERTRRGPRRVGDRGRSTPAAEGRSSAQELGAEVAAHAPASGAVSPSDTRDTALAVRETLPSVQDTPRPLQDTPPPAPGPPPLGPGHTSPGPGHIPHRPGHLHVVQDISRVIVARRSRYFRSAVPRGAAPRRERVRPP